MFRSLVVLIAATAWFAFAADVRLIEEIAAKVNGEIVTRGDLEELRAEVENEMRQQGATPAQIAQNVKQTMDNALRDKIDELLLIQKGKDDNISVDADVTKEIAQMQVREKISDPDKFAQWVLAQYGVTLEEYKQREKDKLMAQRVVSEEVASRIFVPEEEKKKYYEAHPDQFIRKEEVFLSQILLSTDGKTPDQAAAAEAKAHELVKRARAGEKFTDLASANSDEVATAKNGGYAGTFLREDLRKEVADIVFAQSRGYVTDPIKLDSPAGFLILRVDDRYEAGQATYDEVKDQIQGILAEPQMTPKIREFLTKLRQDAFLEIRDGYEDTGAAPGKDTSWHEAVGIKPQTITKDKLAELQRKKFLGIIPYGHVGPTKPAPGVYQPTPAQPSQPAADQAAQPAAPVQK
jgi:parvulin-like peptidyl-prolyl isomerase